MSIRGIVRMKKYEFVFSNLKGYRTKFSCAMAATVLNGLLALLPTVIIGKIVDGVLYNELGQAPDDRIALMWKYIIIFIAVTLITTVIRFINREVCYFTAQHVAVGIRSKLYAKLQTLDYAFYTQNASGELISQLSTDVNVIHDFFGNILYTFVRDCSTLVFTFVILTTKSVIVSCMLLIFLPAIIIFAVILHRTTKMLHRRLRDKFSEINSYVNENLGAYRVVKAFAREDYEISRLTKESEEYRDMAVGNAQKRLNYATPIHIVSEMMRIFALCACGIMIIAYPQTGFTVGNLTVFTSLVFTIAARVRELSVIISQFQQFPK